MNAGPTANRVYEDLRRLVVSGGLPPGAHLDPVVLASELAASTTPIREALNRLAGEDLVEQRAGSGAFLPLPDELALKDMYAWTGEIAALALRTPDVAARLPAASLASGTDYADRLAAALHSIAAASSSAEHAAAMVRINARIHAVRIGEPHVISGASSELARIEAAIAHGDIDELRRSVREHVRHRRSQAGELLRRRYRHT